MNKVSNPILLSKLVSMEDSKFTSWDIINILNEDVSSHLNILYIKVINMLSNGNSYDEIIKMIDNYDGFDEEELLHEQKVYVKTKIKSDLNKRKINTKEINYE